MGIQSILSDYQSHTKTQNLAALTNSGTERVHIQGLSGSAAAIVVAQLYQQHQRQIVCCFSDKEEAIYFYDDVNKLLDEKRVFFFPASYVRSIAYKKRDQANIILRTDALKALSKEQDIILVTYPEAVVEKVIPGKRLRTLSQEVNKGDLLDIYFLQEVWESYGFERVDFVYEPGQYAIRGGIMDIFSFSMEYPVRIDFFGDKVEGIRTFDIENQLSITKMDSITVMPDVNKNLNKDKLIPLTNLFKENALVWYKRQDLFLDRLNDVYQQALTLADEDEEDENLHARIANAEEWYNLKLTLVSQNAIQDAKKVEFQTSPQPRFHKNFDLLFAHLNESAKNNITSYIYCSNESQLKRLTAIFNDSDTTATFEPVLGVLHEGFSDKELRKNYYTDHEIFERYHRVRLKTDKLKSGSASLSLKEVNQLNPGDYVVHSDHGVGKFGGLITTDINGKPQEVIKITYKDNDILFVSIHSLHKISKFKGKDGEPPKVNKLGTGAWQKMKSTTKKKVKDIARELIALYAKRREEKGFAYSPDTYLQTELEASFIYEDTPDQEKATAFVKADMEKPEPMDRLVCGDVGFGKTEVAMRAAFKAVCDNKQVAVLVPTTILAFQHHKSFKERFKDFPVTVDYVSRFRTTKEINQIKKDVEAGKIDILIGTHRIINKDIVFKDLGLFIVDEEQKFGVAVKEKLKEKRVNIDNLTLTATPIPRTLQFSLMGARDLSVINTPPPNRHPIQTELHAFNEAIIRDAVLYEIERNGQVFFIHNRVQNIRDVEASLKRIVPEARIIVGHGQMDGKELEKIMLAFMAGDYDILLATTIIESGLDIPNANTIFINEAQRFGLSEMHQLRGRVGRSNKRAFCYLLSPPIASLPADSRRRLQAIESFSELGSGFNISLQDLDIRGAGNLLGGEQSGFIANIGLETYHQILNEAMLELQETEFKDVYKDRNTESLSSKFVNDCQIDSDFDLKIPSSYVSNVAERMNLYRELDNTKDEQELTRFSEKLVDRFGEVPEQTVSLLNMVRLRWLAMEVGVEKIVLKSAKFIAYFISNQDSVYYKSQQFEYVLKTIQAQPTLAKIKDSGDRLSLVFSNVSKPEEAIALLNIFYLKKNEEFAKQQ